MKKLKSIPPKRLFSLREAGHYLGRTEAAIREMVWSGKLPYVKIDRRIFLDRLDMDRLIEKNKVSFSW